MMQAATDSGHGSLVHILTQLIEGEGINIHGQGSLNWGDDVDNTALRQAAHRGSADMLQLLIERGASTQIKNSDRLPA